MALPSAPDSAVVPRDRPEHTVQFYEDDGLFARIPAGASVCAFGEMVALLGADGSIR